MSSKPHYFLGRCLTRCGLKHTYEAIEFQVKTLEDTHKPLEALSLLAENMQSQAFWFHHRQKWWQLMDLAIDIIKKHKLYEQPTPQLQQLFKISLGGPQPWQGKTIADCFATLSDWANLQGKAQRAQVLEGIAELAKPRNQGPISSP